MRSVRGSRMRAVLVRQIGGVEQMKVEDNVAIPTIGDKQVLIKVHVSGINPVDTYIREGSFFTLPKLPYIPGEDAAGTVEAVGKGGYSLQARAHAKKGERVLVHGASGAVGLAAVQIGVANGLRVFGTAGTPEGLDLVKQMGAEAVFNHQDKKYISELQKGEKFDIILEMLARENLGKDLTLMRPRGRTIVVGSRGTVSINPANIIAVEGYVIGIALETATPEEWKELSEGVMEGINAGWVTPVVDRQYTLEEAGKAHHDIINSKGAKGNLVVKLQD